MAEQKTGPQYDPQPGDVMTNNHIHAVYTVTHVTGDSVRYQRECPGEASRDGRLSLRVWSLDADGQYTYTRHEAPKAEGPQYDPQPGDTMTHTREGTTYTVGRVEVHTDPADSIVYDTTCKRWWPVWLWATDCGGDYTYARPEAPKARTAEDARVDPQPGDTMTYAHDEDVYTVTSTDADSVTCTVRLSRTNWSDAWDGEWVYAPGTGHVPDDVEPCADAKAETAPSDDTADRLAQALAEAEAARAERLQGTLNAVLAGWDDDRATLESAALYLTACRAVMSPDQHAVVEILVALAGRPA